MFSGLVTDANLSETNTVVQRLCSSQLLVSLLAASISLR